MSDKVLTITDSSVQKDVLESSTPVLVDFWAEWCGPCKAIAPIVEELAKEFDGKVKFCKINVDDNSETAAKYGIRGIPTLILFKDGKPANQIVGAASKEKFVEFLNKSI